MFKVVVFCGLLMSAVKASPFVAPGEVTIENFDFVDSRISSGLAAKKGENLDFCYLSINFYNKRQTCGCVILTSTSVATSARCVVDCTEKTATNITVTFPQKSGKDAVRRVRKIYIPDGVNGNGAIQKYDETMEVPLTSFHAGSNVAVLILESEISLDGKTAKDTYIVDEETAAELLARTGSYKYRACGIGNVDNKGTLPKSVMCTDVNVVASDKCAIPHQAGAFYTVPDTFACIQWPAMDNNLCAGDYGGPIYVYQEDPKGAAINQEVFCTSVGSPDIRKSATCQDGHTTFCQFWNTPVFNWAFDPSSTQGNDRKSTIQKTKVVKGKKVFKPE